MYIDSIELEGYEHLSLNNIDYIRINFQEMMQLILGSNGSGKSSLLKELSPLPADPNDYRRGGGKTVYITHQSRSYLLKSMFVGSSNKYSFVMDGEELNPGQTLTIYRDLVKQHFNITAEIHKVLTNEKSFCKMTTAERRAWFTACSQADYTYAIQFYNKLKENLRDLQGSLKRTNERLVNEKQDILSLDEIRHCEETLAVINRLIRHFLECKHGDTQDSEAIVRLIQSSERELQNTKLRLGKQSEYVTTQLSRYQSENHARIHLDALRTSIASTKTALSYVTAQSRELDQNIALLSSKQLGTLSELQVLHDSYLIEIQKLQATIPEDIYSVYRHVNDNDLTSLVNYFNNSNQLTSQLALLRPDPQRSMTMANAEKLKAELETLESGQRQLEWNISQANEQLAKLESEQHNHEDNIQCPRCEFEFHPSVAGKRVSQLNVQIETSSKQLATLIPKIGFLRTSIEEHHEYLSMLNDITTHMRAVPAANDIWTHILNRNMLREDPVGLANWLTTLTACLNTTVSIRSFEREIASIEGLRSSMSGTINTDIGEMRKKLSGLENDMLTLKHCLTKDEAKATTLTRVFNDLAELRTATESLTSIMTTIRELRDSLGKSLTNQLADKFIYVLDDERIRLERVVAKQSARQAVIQSLEQEVVALDERIGTAKLAVSALSPSDGLIAQGMTGFINQFLDQMNVFMARIWQYAIEIVPVHAQDGQVDLDYKFPFRANNGKPREDVAKGSSAQQEIIDLAHRVTSMRYLGIAEYPVFLDEFGAKFDKAHRDAAFHVVSTLSSTTSFSQIFMVSHHEQSYNSLRNAGIIVLCPKNIVMPEGSHFNKNVFINQK